MTIRSPSFRPFEYMAWSKAVPPGARYPMHVSGLPPPGAEIALPSLPASLWTDPIQATREAFAARVATWLGAPHCALATASGASEGVFLALAAVIERGQPVVVEQPAYRAIERAAQFLGGEPVRLERFERENWRLDPERLDALLATTGARAAGISDPHNPTGVSIDGATRAAVIDVIERRGAVLVVDEIFAPFRGPERPAAWAASSRRVLSVGSLTKGWGLSSLRAGWVLGDPGLIERCTRLFDLLGVNAPTATSAMALAALDQASVFDRRALAASTRVREVFAAAAWGGATLVPPDDGIIAYLKLPPGRTSAEVAATLRELDGVQVVPGHFFGHDDHVRIGFAPEVVEGEEGCRLVGVRVQT